MLGLAAADGLGRVSLVARSRAGRGQVGEAAYLTLWAQAVALMQSLARNHALGDGNKRMAWAASSSGSTASRCAHLPQSLAKRFVADVIDVSLAVPQIAERLASRSTPACL